MKIWVIKIHEEVIENGYISCDKMLLIKLNLPFVSFSIQILFKNLFLFNAQSVCVCSFVLKSFILL